MNPSDEVCVDLLRQIRDAHQLQQAWTLQHWHAGQDPNPAAAMLLSEIQRSGEVRLSELAKRRMVDISVVSRQVAQLAEAELIERRPSPDDGRATLVRISAKGEEHLDRWRRHHIDFVRNALADWDEAALRDLTERLGAVVDDLRTAVADTAGNAERPATGRR